MQKPLNALARYMAAALMNAALVMNERRNALPRGADPKQWDAPTGGGKRYGNKTGKTYPEQGARQQLRGMRRAQGGPGITEGASPQARTA